MKWIRLVVLVLLSVRSFAQDNTTTTDVSLKLYVSVGHVELTRDKGDASPPANSSGANSDKYDYESYTRTDGFTGALDWENALIAHNDWEVVSNDGHTIKWRKLKASGGAATSPAPNKASGSATVTITGKATVAKPTYEISVGDILTSQLRFSGDPKVSDAAGQEIKSELCNVTKSLLDNKTIKLSKADIGELV